MSCPYPPHPHPPSTVRHSRRFVPSGGRREGMEDPTGGRRDGGNDTRWTEHDDQGTDVNAVSKPLASVLCSLRLVSMPFTPVQFRPPDRLRRVNGVNGHAKEASGDNVRRTESTNGWNSALFTSILVASSHSTQSAPRNEVSVTSRVT